MIRILIVVALIWVALLPPLFTDGACTAEYEAAAALVSASEPGIRTPDAALQFFQAKAIPVTLLTPEDCARSKPRFLTQCSSGTLVYADVPVRNKICRFYRDDVTLLQLQYDRRGRLSRALSEMSPYKFLSLPWGGRIDWAR